MASRIKEIPKGFHTVTPYLTVSDSERAIDFYKRAFWGGRIVSPGFSRWKSCPC